MIVVGGYLSVNDRINELGCRVPQGLAIIPRNFQSAGARNELFYDTSASILRDLMKLGGVAESSLEPDGEKFPLREEPPDKTVSYADIFPWQWPTLYAHATFLNEDELVVGKMLDSVSDFLVHWFKRSPDQERNVKLALVIEKPDGTCKQVQYDGPAAGLSSLMTILREVGRG